MAFTEEQLAAQESKLAELKEELSRLNSVFDAQLKASGLTEATLKELSLDSVPPEVKKMLDKASDEAQRAGQARAEQTRQATARPATGPSRRRDVIKY
jgi:hypothetical protein